VIFAPKTQKGRSLSERNGRIVLDRFICHQPQGWIVPDMNDSEVDYRIRHPAPEGGGFKQHLPVYAGRAGFESCLLARAPYARNSCLYT